MWWRRLRYVLLLAALCAIATCPAAKRACTEKVRTRESDELLTYLADRVAAHVAATGRVPAEPAAQTPGTSCCDQGGACAVDPSLWKTPAWQALQFSVDDESRFTYAYLPDPSGRSAIVRAVGDVDCDGVVATYEIEVRVDGEGVKRSWTRQNRYE